MDFKMKIALCLSGQPRGIPYSCQQILDNIINDFIPDVPNDVLDINPSELYSRLKDIGLMYGDNYRSIYKIKSKGGECWSKIIRYKNAPDRTLIDGCLQTVAACMLEQNNLNQLFLPVSIEKFSFSIWPLPDQFNCYSRLVSIKDSSTLLFDLILEVDNNTIGYIKGLKLKKLRASNCLYAYIDRTLYALNKMVKRESILKKF